MRGAFSEQFNRAVEESSILKKTIIRISALVISASVFFVLFLYAYQEQGVNLKSLNFKNYIIYALVPSIIGAICAIYVYSNVIYHIRRIIEELSKKSPDWHSLEDEYMESDIKSLYIAIRRLHDTLSDQQKIEEAHEETRKVLDELNTRSDEERRSIARQLHDDMNPKLILSKLELHKLIPIINKNIADQSQSAEARQIVTKVTDFVGSVYQDSRNIIKNTRFEIIDSIGLTAAIESMVLDYQKVLDKLSIHFEHNLPKRPDLSSVSTINAYRIIQEAVLNAIKHSDAKNVSITVQINQDKHCIDVVIVDDGIGINTKNARGVGLIDMRERARVLGSVLHIESKPEGGTKISFSFENSANLLQEKN